MESDKHAALAAEIRRQDEAFSEAFAQLEALDPDAIVAVPEDFLEMASAPAGAGVTHGVDWSRRA
jgi:hypothetical protein